MWLKGVYNYHLPFIKPLQMKSIDIPSRNGLLFNYSKDNISVWGDAAPFPGLHKESVDDILHWLKSKSHLIKNLNEIEDVETPFPSVDFAVSSCFFQWQAKKKGSSLRNFLNPKAKHKIYVNALITGTGKDSLQSLKESLNKGYKSFKVKVGRQNIADDIDLIKNIAGKLTEGSLLRLDANQAWGLEEAKNFCTECADLPIEYLEEPLKNNRDIPELHKESPLAIALDETLYDQEPVF